MRVSNAYVLPAYLGCKTLSPPPPACCNLGMQRIAVNCPWHPRIKFESSSSAVILFFLVDLTGGAPSAARRAKGGLRGRLVCARFSTDPGAETCTRTRQTQAVYAADIFRA